MSKDTKAFAEWLHKNAKPVKNNDPFKWKVVEMFKDYPVTEYCTTEDLYKMYKKSK